MEIEYLSENVRRKLAMAEEYAKTNPDYKRNVTKLKIVIPQDIKAKEMTVKFGSPWIDAKDYTKFLQYLNGRESYDSRRCDVSYSLVIGEFDMMNAGSKKNLNLNETTTYGTIKLDMYQLAEKIMNQLRLSLAVERNLQSLFCCLNGFYFGYRIDCSL